MTTSKIKFKISLKELSFEFEGDRETAERVTQGINKTLGSLQGLQDDALGSAPPQALAAPADVIDVSPSASTRKKARRRSPGEASASISGGVSEQLIGMRDEGFFAQPRVMSEILDDLKRKGYSYKNHDVSKPLLNLARSRQLNRARNAAKKQWEYTKGPVA